MQTFASIWLILGIVIVIAMITFSLFKKIKWKTTGIAALVYILGLTVLVLTVKPADDKTTHSSKPKSAQTVKKSSVKFNIISKKDKDTVDYVTDKNGNFNLKIKSLGNGKIYVKDGDPNSDYKNEFKTVTLNVKKGDVKTVPLSLSTDDPTREYTIKSSTGYKKHIEVYNFSDAYSASESAEESSEFSSSASSSSDSYKASLNARKDNWNNSSDGDAIHVSKIWKDGHTTFVSVNEGDWDSLSESDKYDFTTDWTKSIQEIYTMNDKNGTTSVQIVSSSNKYHMLAHGTGSGNVKIDD